jgi:hypothetical protein
MNLEDAMNLYGGPLTLNDFPAIIPPRAALSILGTLSLLIKNYEALFPRYGFEGSIVIALTNSPGFSCRVRVLDDGTYAILVPVGMPARVRSLARLLLRHWGQESKVMLLRSLRDNIFDQDKTIPPLLQPIMLIDPEYDNFWDQLADLEKAAALDARFEPDLLELVHLALLYLVSHEISHVLNGHFALNERAKNEDLGLTPQEIRRGIELDADDNAAAVTMYIMHHDIAEARKAGRDEHYATGWLRLGYVVTLLFGMYDAQRKYLFAYDTNEYNHPVVRCELFIQGAVRSFDGPEDARQELEETLSQGWKNCVFAFNDLNLDAMQGLFGKLPEGADLAPLHALIYAQTDTMAIGRLLEDSNELLRKTRALLPIYQNSKE